MCLTGMIQVNKSYQCFVVCFKQEIMIPCTTQAAGRADDLEKEQDKDEKTQHDSLPVISTTFSLSNSPASHHDFGVSFKRKRQTTTEPEISSADALSCFRDEDELFLLSLLPSLKRLNNKKRMEVRMKFQQVLYAAEFEDYNA